MKKPHAMMWYPEAWKSSPKVTAMPAAARAGYFDLLCAVWLNGASLPNDDAMLQACSRLTPAEWKRHRITILAMFTVEDGELKNDRLTREYERTIEKIEKRKAAAEARWANKQKQSKSNANALHMQCNADASRSRTRDRSTSNEVDTPKPPQGAIPAPTPKRQVFGEFGWVQLSEQEVQKLHERVGIETAADYIARFDQWVEEAPNAKHSGVKRKDRKAYASILNWIDRDQKEGKHDTRTKRQQIADADDIAILGALRKRSLDRAGAQEVAQDLPNVRSGDDRGRGERILRLVSGS